MPASRPTLNAPTFIVKTGKILNLTDSLRVQGEIEDVACQFVVDTGSNITIVRPDVVKDVVSARCGIQGIISGVVCMSWTN